jgi:hypothetical protein
LRSSAPQVAQQDVAGLAAQREIERVVGLNLVDAQSLMPPIQIVQFQMNQFGTAQSISRRQVKEGPVTPSLSIGGLDGSQQQLNLIPRPGTRCLPFSAAWGAGSRWTKHDVILYWTTILAQCILPS